MKELLMKDILYSLGIMNAHTKNTLRPWTGDKDILNAMFVGSMVKGRLLLELLGLKIDQGELVEIKKSSINIEDLGGSRVILADLNSEQNEILRKFLISTNKHEAHLTLHPHDNLDHIKPGFEIINDLLKKHLPM